VRNHIILSNAVPAAGTRLSFFPSLLISQYGYDESNPISLKMLVRPLCKARNMKARRQERAGIFKKEAILENLSDLTPEQLMEM
jgi:hypothetical protein